MPWTPKPKFAVQLWFAPEAPAPPPPLAKRASMLCQPGVQGEAAAGERVVELRAVDDGHAVDLQRHVVVDFLCELNQRGGAAGVGNVELPGVDKCLSAGIEPRSGRVRLQIDDVRGARRIDFARAETVHRAAVGGPESDHGPGGDRRDDVGAERDGVPSHGQGPWARTGRWCRWTVLPITTSPAVMPARSMLDDGLAAAAVPVARVVRLATVVTPGVRYEGTRC